MGFPGGSVVKDPPANARDMGSIPGSGRSPGEGNDNPLQYSCLGNPMDRGAWRATVPDPGIEPRSPALQWILYHLNHQGSPDTERRPEIPYWSSG